jgi:uncharacterized protein with FMN-binding domain
MKGRKKEPTDVQQRGLIASACFKDLKLTMPFLLDEMSGTAEKAYIGWPNRIYVIDKSGKVAMKGRRGPRGADIPGAEKALARLVGKPAITTTEKPAKVARVAPLPAIKDVPDGSYSGSAEGFGGKLSVKLDVKLGKITAAAVTGHKETKSRKPIRKALQSLPAQIVRGQSTKVDAVTGATYTSKAIVKAAENALRSAAKKK